MSVGPEQEVETQEEVSTEAPESRADAIGALLDAAEKDDAPAPVVQEAAPKVEAVAPAPTEVKPPAAEAPPPTEAQQAAPEGEKPASIKTEKAPQSWTPAAREKWATLPGEVRAEVMRREKEVARVLQESAEARKTADAFKAKLSPYEAMIRSEGHEPLAAVESLLQTATALRTAPPAHKAAIVAGIIAGHGIPVEMVAQALQGKLAAPQPQVQAADPRAIAAQVRQEMEREAAQREQQHIESELSEFASSHEHFDDVAPYMLAIVQGDMQRGLKPNLEAAYNAACRANQDVWNVMQQREAAQKANATQASTRRAIAASASVRGGPAGGVKRSPPRQMSRMEALDAAFADFE